jgi:hypothetical protein
MQQLVVFYEAYPEEPMIAVRQFQMKSLNFYSRKCDGGIAEENILSRRYEE